jgi:hypothetical protein
VRKITKRLEKKRWRQYRSDMLELIEECWVKLFGCILYKCTLVYLLYIWVATGPYMCHGFMPYPVLAHVFDIGSSTWFPWRTRIFVVQTQFQIFDWKLFGQCEFTNAWVDFEQQNHTRFSNQFCTPKNLVEVYSKVPLWFIGLSCRTRRFGVLNQWGKKIYAGFFRFFFL